MAAATENQDQSFQAGRIVDIQMDSQANVAEIFKGTIVDVVIAAGFARPATATAAHKVMGVAMEKFVQTVGDAAGANKIRVAVQGVFTFNAAGMAQDDVGKRVNVEDDNTVTLTGANTIRVGTIVEVISATRVRVAIDIQTP